MDLKGLMSGLGMNAFAIIALLVFFSTFVGIVFWAWTRPRREMDAHAKLPLENDE
jgi:cbb3-type cytochrome oxidase subunit 3